MEAPRPSSWEPELDINFLTGIDCPHIESTPDAIFTLTKYTDIVSTSPGVSLLMRDDPSGLTCRNISSGGELFGKIEMRFGYDKAWANKDSVFELSIDESSLRSLTPRIAPVTSFRFKIIDVTDFAWFDGKTPHITGIGLIFPDTAIVPGARKEEGMNIPINTRERLDAFIERTYDPLNAFMPPSARIALTFSQPLVSFGFGVEPLEESYSFEWKTPEGESYDSTSVLYYSTLESRKRNWSLIPGEMYWLEILRKPPEFVGGNAIAQGISGESINYYINEALIFPGPDKDTVNLPFRASPVRMWMDNIYYNRSALGEHFVTMKDVQMMFRWDVEDAGGEEAVFAPTTSLKYALSKCTLASTGGCYDDCHPITTPLEEDYDESRCGHGTLRGRDIIGCPRRDMTLYLPSGVEDIDSDLDCEFEVRGGVSGQVHGKPFHTPYDDYLLETYPVNLRMKRPVIRTDGGVDAEDIVWGDNVIEHLCIWVDEKITELRLRDADGTTFYVRVNPMFYEETEDGSYLYCWEDLALPGDFQMDTSSGDEAIYSVTVVDEDGNESLPSGEIRFHCDQPPRKYVDDGWYVSMDADERGDPFIIYTEWSHDNEEKILNQIHRVAYSYYEPTLSSGSGHWVTADLIADVIDSLQQRGDTTTASLLSTFWNSEPAYTASDDSGPDVVIDADGLPQICVVASWEERARPVSTDGADRYSANSHLFYFKAIGKRPLADFHVYDWQVKIIDAPSSAEKNPYMADTHNIPVPDTVVRPFGCAIAVNKKVSGSPAWIAFTGQGAPSSSYLTSPWYARIDWIPEPGAPAPGVGRLLAEIDWLRHANADRALGTQIDVAVNPIVSDTEVHAHFVSVGDVGDFQNDLLFHGTIDGNDRYFTGLNPVRKLFYCEIPEASAYEHRQCTIGEFIGNVPAQWEWSWGTTRTSWARPSIAVRYNHPFIVATGIVYGRSWLMDTVTYKSYLFLLTRGNAGGWSPGAIDFIDEAPSLPQAGTRGVPAKVAVDEGIIKVGYIRQEHFDPRMLKVVTGPVTALPTVIYTEPGILPANTREAHVSGSLYLAERVGDFSVGRRWWDQSPWSKTVVDALVEHGSSLGMALSRSGYSRIAYQNALRNFNGGLMLSQVHYFPEESYSQLFEHEGEPQTCYDRWYHRWDIDRNAATLTLSPIGGPIGYALSQYKYNIGGIDVPLRNAICNNDNYRRNLLGPEVDVGTCGSILESYGYFLNQLKADYWNDSASEYVRGDITNFSPDRWAEKRDPITHEVEEGYIIPELHDPIDNSLISEIFRGVTLKNGWPALKEQENVCLPQGVGCTDETMSYASTMSYPQVPGECRSIDKTGNFVSELADASDDCLSCFDPSFIGGEELAGFMKTCSVDEDCVPPYYCIEFADLSGTGAVSGDYSPEAWTTLAYNGDTNPRRFCALPRFFTNSTEDQAECQRLGGTMNIGGPFCYKGNYGITYCRRDDPTACYIGIQGDIKRFCGRWDIEAEPMTYRGPCFWRNADGSANLTRLIPAAAGGGTFECIAAGCATCVNNMYCVPGIEGKECPSGHECIEAATLKQTGQTPPLTPMCVLRQIFDNYWYLKTVDAMTDAEVEESILSQFEDINDQVQGLIRDSKLARKFMLGGNGYVDDLYMHIKSSLDEAENKTGIHFVTAMEPAGYGNDERQGEIWIILDIDTSEEHRGGIAFSGMGQGGGCETDLEGRIPENSDHLYYRIRVQPYFFGELNDWRKTGRIMFVVKGMELLTSLDPEVFLTRDEVYLNFDCAAANWNWFQSDCMGMDPELEIYEQISAKLREKLGDRLLTVISSIFQVLLENPAVAYPMFGQRCYPDPYYWDTYREDVPHAMAVAGNLANPGSFQVIYRGRGETCDPFYFSGDLAPYVKEPLDITTPGPCAVNTSGCYEIEHAP